MTNIEVQKWETSVINFTFYKNSVVLNITWFTINFYVKDEVDSASLSIETTGTIVSAVAWTARVTLSSSDTNLTPWHYYYEVRLVDWSAKYNVWWVGNFIIQDILKVPS